MKFSFLPWQKAKRRRPPVEEVRAPTVHFLGAQDGPLERDIEEQWHPILAAYPAVRRAFLTQATYGDRETHVVLALCTGGIPDLDLVTALRVPFAAIFAADCPLDMIFVNPHQETQVAGVCAPFYVAA
jgi:hypothetical protein